MKAGLNLPKAVSICEQAVEEGFQCEERFIPTDAKVFLVQGLVDAGFKQIAVSMFSHPRVLPQFRDCEEVHQRIPRKPDVVYRTPTFNMRALERAVKAKKQGVGPDVVTVQVATSEFYAKKVLGVTVEEEWKAAEELIKVAHDNGLKVEGAIAGAWTLMGGGVTPPELTLEYVDKFMAMGADEIQYQEDGAELYKPTPSEVYELFSRILDKYPNPELHSLHYHNRYGFSLAILLAAMQAGITHFDTCLGGCPTGRIAGIVDDVPVGGGYGARPPVNYYITPYYYGLPDTEDFVAMCKGMGVETGVDLNKVLDLGRWMEKIVGRKLWSFCLKATVRELEVVW